MVQQEFRRLSHSFYIFLVVFGINVANFLILDGNSYTLLTAGPFVKTLYNSDYYIIMLMLSGALSLISLMGVAYYYKNGYVPQIFVKATLAFGVVTVAVFAVNVMSNKGEANSGLLDGSGFEQKNPASFRETGDVIEKKQSSEEQKQSNDIQARNGKATYTSHFVSL